MLTEACSKYLRKLLQLVSRWNQVNEVVYSQFVAQLVCHFYLLLLWLSPNANFSSSSSSSSDLVSLANFPPGKCCSLASLNAALIDLYQRWLGQNQQSESRGVNPNLRLALLDRANWQLNYQRKCRKIKSRMCNF